MLDTISAFASAFSSGGVRVGFSAAFSPGGSSSPAAAILTSAGAGGGPQTTIFSGSTFTEIDSFYSLSQGFPGGQFIAG